MKGGEKSWNSKREKERKEMKRKKKKSAEKLQTPIKVSEGQIKITQNKNI